MAFRKKNSPLVIGLSVLFQLVFTAFVALSNPEALVSYVPLAVLGFIFSVLLLFYIEKSKGNTTAAFIFSTLIAFGMAVQATLNKPTGSTIGIYLIVFCASFVVLACYDYFNAIVVKHESAVKVIASAGTIALVVVMLVAGKGQDNTRNWLDIGFSVQLTELLKIPFVYLLSTIPGKKNGFELHSVDNKGFIKSIILMLGFGLVFVLSNEFGTLLVLLFVWIVFLYFFVENRRAYYTMISAGATVLIVTLIVVYSIVNSGMEVDNPIVSKLVSRIGTFVSIDFDYNQSYQIITAQEGISLGGLLGSGSNYMEIVNAENDMIFPYIVLKLGMIVGLLVFAAFVVLFIKIQKAMVCSKAENHVLCTSVNMLLLSQAVVNIFASVNMMPLTGIPLSFGISDGGTWTLLSSALFMYLLRNTCKEQLNIKLKKQMEVVDEFYHLEEGADDEYI